MVTESNRELKRKRLTSSSKDVKPASSEISRNNQNDTEKEEESDDFLNEIKIEESSDEGESDEENSENNSEEDDDDDGEEEGNGTEVSTEDDGESDSEEEEEEEDDNDDDDDDEEDEDADESDSEEEEEGDDHETLTEKNEKLDVKEKLVSGRKFRSDDKSIIKDVKIKKQKQLDTNISVKETYDEYADGDTSDEEDIRNTIGNVPVNWYDDYKHLGYDWEGKRILKPDRGDQIDYFLKRMEDPDFWRTVRDPQTGQDVVLSDGDVNLIQRLESQKIPDEAYDEYAPWIEWFTSEVMKMPLRKFPEHKRSFLPSLSEKRKVAKLVHALKMGWIKPTKQMQKERRRKEQNGPQYYMLWESDNLAEKIRRIRAHIPAPRRQLPGHAESYNPPSEYLFSEKEMKKFKASRLSMGNQRLHFIPQKYNSLRQVPAYHRFIIERFTRCLDLVLCPRAVRMKLLIQPEDLLPKLPDPKDLQPFPTVHSLLFKGHTDMVRTISMDPMGQYIVSGSDDKTVKFWEISTGRCLKTVQLNGIVRCVRWCPSTSLSLVAAAADDKCFLINPGIGDSLVSSKTDEVLLEPPPQDTVVPERVSAAVQWHWKKDHEDWVDGVLVVIKHFKEIKQIAWHGRGDYFATVMPDGLNRSVIIHQLSKGRSQIPFNKTRGLVQCVIFHPIRPFFFVATQRNVRVYDLVKQEMAKKLSVQSKWISNMAIHPGGDNLLVSTYDKKVLWFDLDLSTTPYKTIRLHNTAVRSVAYHKRYPLFASVADDCSLIISHGMVYNDLLQNPLIVPLKRLSHHTNENDFGIFEVMFHHYQPWVLTCGADNTIRLYS